MSREIVIIFDLFFDLLGRLLVGKGSVSAANNMVPEDLPSDPAVVVIPLALFDPARAWRRPAPDFKNFMSMAIVRFSSGPNYQVALV